MRAVSDAKQCSFDAVVSDMKGIAAMSAIDELIVGAVKQGRIAWE